MYSRIKAFNETEILLTYLELNSDHQHECNPMRIKTLSTEPLLA